MVRIRVQEDNPNPIVIDSVLFLTSSTKDDEKELDNSNSSKGYEKYERLSLIENADVSSRTSHYNQENRAAVTVNEKIIPFKRDVYSILSAMYENEVFETGIVNPSEKYFIEEYAKDAIGVINTLNLLFWNNFEAIGRKSNNLIGVLHTISHLNYEDLYPIGVSIAVGALNHRNQEVCEYAIKCFENWNHPDGVKKLKTVQFAFKWLEEYASAVIEEIDS